MTSSESPPTAEVNAAIRELAGIFAAALLRRPRTGPTPETSPVLAKAGFSCLARVSETALCVPDRLRTRETQGERYEDDAERGEGIGGPKAAQRASTSRQIRRTLRQETRTRNKAWLVKRLIWRIQAKEEGDLSARARARAAELADEADLRLSPPKPRKIENGRHHTVEVATTWDTKDRLPPPGTVIRRPYKGKMLEVRVLPTGFEYGGEAYKSLSAVANKITGSHCNGFQFFRLKNQEGAA